VGKRGAAEFLTGLGANVGVAFALREAVRAIVKVIAPGGGSVVSATIAFSGTMAIGSAARAYYIRGLSLSDARRAFRTSKRASESGSETDGAAAGGTEAVGASTGDPPQSKQSKEEESEPPR
jgi:uncharacterized protein (DUF697 family)